MARTHDEFVNEFKALDEERIRAAAARTRRAHAERAIAAMNANGKKSSLCAPNARKSGGTAPSTIVLGGAERAYCVVSLLDG